MLIHPALAKSDGLHGLRRANPTPTETSPVEIRLAWPSDAPALVRLAQLDSALAAAAELPGRAAAGDVLVAIVDDEPVAALSVADGLLVSDPFHRTDSLIALLHLRRQQLMHAERRLRRGRLGMLRLRHT